MILVGIKFLPPARLSLNLSIDIFLRSETVSSIFAFYAYIMLDSTEKETEKMQIAEEIEIEKEKKVEEKKVEEKKVDERR